MVRWWPQQPADGYRKRLRSLLRNKLPREAPPETRYPTWASSCEAADQHPVIPAGTAALTPRMGADLPWQSDSTLPPSLC